MSKLPTLKGLVRGFCLGQEMLRPSPFCTGSGHEPMNPVAKGDPAKSQTRFMGSTVAGCRSLAEQRLRLREKLQQELYLGEAMKEAFCGAGGQAALARKFYNWLGQLLSFEGSRLGVGVTEIPLQGSAFFVFFR